MKKVRKIWICIKLFFGFKIIADCGHKTKKDDNVCVRDKQIKVSLRIQENGRMIFCHKCFEKMIIFCAWCGSPIFIGDPITLYSPKDDFKIPSHAKIYEGDGVLKLVGCFGWDCAVTGADRAGFWIPPGKVKRVPSPIEIAMATREIVIIQDLFKE